MFSMRVTLAWLQPSRSASSYVVRPGAVAQAAEDSGETRLRWRRRLTHACASRFKSI